MDKQKYLEKLFEKWSGEAAIKCEMLPPSGSYREYYRISGKSKQAMGVYNVDTTENRAFISFSKHFFRNGISVPEIYIEGDDKKFYLISDLGDETLYSFVTKTKKGDNFPKELITVYKKVIDEMPKLQIVASIDMDYSVCYPRSAFDKQSIMWDLNYFKYHFLKLAKIPFDEQKLEDDFHTFANYLLEAESNYFLFRDFQSRNIMLYDNKPYFIDYQGGRRGALQYDLASLLYDAKASIPDDIRHELLEYYMLIVSDYVTFDKKKFVQFFYGFVLVRILQAFGAYGFRGLYEGKQHFVESIPPGIQNVEELLKSLSLPIEIPAIMGVLQVMIESKELRQIDNYKKN